MRLLRFCLHQGFVAGPWRDVASDRDGWREMLKSFSITLGSSSGVERRGSGSNVLGSPVLALKAIVDELGQHPDRQPIEAGEIVTTGTITELMPVMAGESWTTEIAGAPLAGLSVQLV